MPLARSTPGPVGVVSLELCGIGLDSQENARQCLYRTAGRCAAHGDAKTGEKRFTGNGELQLVLPYLLR